MVHDRVERAAHARIEVARTVFLDAVRVADLAEFRLEPADERFAACERLARLHGIAARVACPIVELRHDAAQRGFELPVDRVEVHVEREPAAAGAELLAFEHAVDAVELLPDVLLVGVERAVELLEAHIQLFDAVRILLVGRGAGDEHVEVLELVKEIRIVLHARHDGVALRGMVLQIVAHGAFRVGAQLDGTLVDLLESRTHGVADSAQHAHVERRRPLTVETAGDALRPFLRTRRVETGLIRVGQQIRHHVGQCGIVEIGVAMHVEPCLFGLDGMLHVFQFRFGTVPVLALVVLLP